MPDALPAMEAAARAAAQMSDALPMVPASTEPTVASAISSELAVDEPAADGDGGPDDDLQPVPAPKNETPVQKLLGEATMHYAYREWNQAVTMLLEVIRLSPAMPHPYHTLGLIYEELLQPSRAIKLFLMAAQLQKRDAQQWRHVATLAGAHGERSLAIYCLGKVVTLQPTNVDALWERSLLLATEGRYKRAADGFAAVLEKRPSDVQAVRRLLRCQHALGQLDRAVAVLEDLLGPPGTLPCNFHLLNMLLELQIEGGRFRDGAQRVNATREAGGARLKLPMDVAVREGVCLAYLDELSEAEARWAPLLDEAAAAARYADLVYEVAKTYRALRQWTKALRLYESLGASPQYANSTHMHVGQCLHEMRRDAEAVDAFRQAAALDRVSVAATLALGRLLLEQRQPAEALDALRLHTAAAAAAAADRDDDGGGMVGASPTSLRVRRAAAGGSRARWRRRCANRRPAWLRALPRWRRGGGGAPPPPRRARLSRPAAKTAAAVVGHAAIPQASELLRAAKRNAALARARPPPPKRLRLDVDGGAAAAEPDGDGGDGDGLDGGAFERRAPAAAAAALDGSVEAAAAAVMARAGETVGAIEEEAAAEAAEAAAEDEAAEAAAAEDAAAAAAAEAEAEGEGADGDGDGDGGVGVVAADGAAAAEEGAVETLVSDALGSELAFQMIAHLGSALVAAGRQPLACEVLSRALEVGEKALWASAEEQRRLRVLCARAAEASSQWAVAYEHARALCASQPENEAAWTFFHSIAGKVQHKGRDERWILRQLLRDPTSAPITLAVSHHCLVSSTYKMATAEYLSLHQKHKDEPLIVLCVAAAVLHTALSRKNPNKPHSALMGIAWLNTYARLRSERPQEVAYNFGRAYHLLGLPHLAVPEYVRALYFRPERAAGGGPAPQDLTREAAHNLARILVTSQNPDLARHILRKFCTV